MNFAFCHATMFRKPGEASPEIIPAGPSHQLNSQGYIRFLSRCANDERFTADILLAEDELRRRLEPARSSPLSIHHHSANQKGTPGPGETVRLDGLEARLGRGRIDPFNPVKVNVLKMPPDDTSATPTCRRSGT